MKAVPAVALALIAVLLIAAAPPSSADDQGASPQELYPDADVIVSMDEEGRVQVDTRLAEPAEDGSLYSTRTYRAGSDITLLDWSDIDGSALIVMTGGDIDDLTLVNLDVRVDPEDPVDVDFVMVAGTVNNLTAVSASRSVSLDDSHFTAYSAVRSLDMEIGGDVGSVSAADCMVEFEEIGITVVEGAVIDRLYPAGDAARCINLYLGMTGGHVGYISNTSTVVTYLDYEFDYGTVDYLCLGADTEGSESRYLQTKWTFYVQRDVRVDIGSMMDIGTAIVGAGILDTPSVLCNGELPSVTVARNVVIEAAGTEIAVDHCFLAGDGKAYHFNRYEVGGTPTQGTLAESYLVGWVSHPMYGEDGLWGTLSDLVVSAGTVLYLDTTIGISDGAYLLVEPAGKVVNAGHIVLSGTLEVQGLFENNGIVERQDGTVVGELTGTGYVATCIFARPNDGRIDVMTVTDDAVVLRSQSGDLSFDSALVRLAQSGARVSIELTETLDIGDFLVVALDRTDSSGHNAAWTLFLSGFKVPEDALDVQVTIPARVPSGYIAHVTDAWGNEMVLSESDAGTLTFTATANGTYYLDLEEDDSIVGVDPLAINAIIAAAIVIVAALAVYLLLRHDRGP